MNTKVSTMADSAPITTSLSNICHVAGYASIAASILIWYMAQGDGSSEAIAHAERFGLFVGLWAPTFFALSMKYDK